MGRTRKKKKCHKPEEELGVAKAPATFVFERGTVGRLLSQLVLDLRQVMAPFTATQLKVTKKNVLKDFVHMAGPLGVSHFIMLSKTDAHINLRVAKIPRGPTIMFHLNNFTLSREVISASKKPPPANSTHYLHPPLLVLNNFTSEDKPTKLMTKMLQGMFPSFSVDTVKLSNVKRCVLFTFNKDTNTIEFRHYGIKVVPRGMTRGVRKIAQCKIPNLKKYSDISDFVLGDGGSESEAEEVEGHVTLPHDLPGCGNVSQQHSAIRLHELGPRMSLQLVKIEADLCDGEVLHHTLVHKSTKEVKVLKTRIEQRKKLKLQRRLQQEDNVRRKQKEREMKRRKERVRQNKEIEGESEEDADDATWYEKEVGVVPEPDLLLSGTKSKGKRKVQFRSTKPAKKPRLSRSSVMEKKKPLHSKLKKFSTGTVFRRKSKKFS